MSKDELDLLIDAVRADVPDEAQASGAQFRLQRVLANPKKEKKSMSTILLTMAGTRAALISLSALITMGAGFFFGLNPTGAPLTFAAVLEQIRDLDTYSSTIVVETHGETAVQLDMAFQEPGKMLMGVGDGIDILMDSESRRMMTLLHDGKMAMIMDIPEDEDGNDAMDFDGKYGRYMMIERLKDYQGQAREVLPTTEINGRMCTGFVVDLEDDMEMTVWIDNETQLPVRAVAVGNEDGPSVKVTIDMDYDTPLKEGIFDMTPPEGYNTMNIDALKSLGDSIDIDWQ
ncbi:MAG: hypothetical protein QNK37_28955 [Acidobacteriota bacterium]|nr:hypothetical protein [Acidobacteriota bacterium]